jgi:hypothetical protein
LIFFECNPTRATFYKVINLDFVQKSANSIVK